ncbi:MAG: hypothetical protein ACUVQV_09140, partial [Dissulfurimicrobium sp.]|uniref:hypothetical protein n=1 Tax=Dissulfurimicrobium sp. TaxID=2022436 RepID=UPI00404B7A48
MVIPVLCNGLGDGQRIPTYAAKPALGLRPLQINDDSHQSSPLLSALISFSRSLTTISWSLLIRYDRSQDDQTFEAFFHWHKYQ